MVRETITSCFKDHVTGSGLCGGHRGCKQKCPVVQMQEMGKVMESFIGVEGLVDP